MASSNDNGTDISLLRNGLNPKKRAVLQEMSDDTTNKMNSTFGSPSHHNNLKKHRTNLQPPKFSLDRLKNDKQNHTSQQRRFSSDDAFKMARLSAGLPLNSKGELLELQIQNERYSHDSVELKKSIVELEYANNKIKLNTDKLKEELYEIDTKIDELQMMIINSKSQNLKKFKIEEKKSHLQCRLLENELNTELYKMEKNLKKEFEEVILKYKDEESLKDIQSLQKKLENKIIELEKLIAEVAQDLNEYEQERSVKYEQDLNDIEKPLNDMTNKIEIGREKLNDLESKNSQSQIELIEEGKQKDNLSIEIDKYLKEIKTSEGEITRQLLEIEKLEKEIKEKNCIFQETEQELSRSQLNFDKENSRLHIERAKKRRILHEIYDLKGKYRCVINLQNTNCVYKQELDSASIEFNNQFYQIDDIFQGEDSLLDDIQCLIESGANVTILNIGNCDISRQIQLVSKDKELVRIDDENTFKLKTGKLVTFIKIDELPNTQLYQQYKDSKILTILHLDEIIESWLLFADLLHRTDII